jgi:5-methylthioadenosine/S-adenosylhomocysteine deaminase
MVEGKRTGGGELRPLDYPLRQVDDKLDSGMRIGMGLDDQSYTDISDPWQNLRMGRYLGRAVSGDPTSLTPFEVLRMHTLGSAEILGIDAKVGSLEPGKFADFVIVDPRAPDSGPLWDPVASFVLACGLRNLKAVYIGGEPKSSVGVLADPIAVEASARIHDILPKIRPYRPPVFTHDPKETPWHTHRSSSTSTTSRPTASPRATRSR